MIKHYSLNIQNVIQRELFAAKKSIKICVAWFTNDLLFQPLILQLNMGVKVELILNKDEINLSDSNDVDFDQFVANGGCLYWNTTDKLLHHKFCIIDDRVVITGSYNWTNKAEYNYEDITVCTEDSESINHYQKIFDKLSQEFPLLKSSETLQQKKNITSRQEQTYTCSIKYITTDGKIIDVSCDKFPDGVKIISNTYRNGLGEMVFDRNIPKIGKRAFSGCSSLTSITIPNSVKWIADYAFEDCRSLTSITIPDRVDFIEEYAFIGCRSLTNVNVIISSLAGYCDYHPSQTFMIPGRKHLYINNMEITTLIIPGNVTVIGYSAFSDCSSLTSVIISDGVIEIVEWAFSGCSSLTNVTIPDSVTEIGDSAFSRCSSLKEFKGKFAADGGRCLIINGILNAFTIGCGVTEYTIPDSVTAIGYNAFSGCTSLANVSIGNSVTKIEGSAFKNCSSLTTITIPDSVTEIGWGAFASCTSLANVFIGNSVTKIEGHAFENCSSLTTITIPDSVTAIGYNAFSGCTSLANVSIGNSVTKIGDHAFSGCGSLAKLYCKSLNPPQIAYGTLGKDKLKELIIYVPRCSVEEYKKSAGWCKYADIIEGYDF